jgi:hypothetical protein
MTEHKSSQNLQLAGQSVDKGLSSATAPENKLFFDKGTGSDPGKLYAIEYTSVSGSTGARDLFSLFPARFAAFIHRDHGRPLKIGLMSLVFITALFSKAYTGEFQQIINNHIGGILYVLFGSLALSVLFPRLKAALPVMIATGATCLLEVIQMLRIPVMTEITRFRAFAYLFGTSFNPKDFLYYGAGALTALLVLWFIPED